MFRNPFAWHRGPDSPKTPKESAGASGPGTPRITDLKESEKSLSFDIRIFLPGDSSVFLMLPPRGYLLLCCFGGCALGCEIGKAISVAKCGT